VRSKGPILDTNILKKSKSARHKIRASLAVNSQHFHCGLQRISHYIHSLSLIMNLVKVTVLLSRAELLEVMIMTSLTLYSTPGRALLVCVAQSRALSQIQGHERTLTSPPTHVLSSKGLYRTSLC
jgi:hypothetical protein